MNTWLAKSSLIIKMPIASPKKPKAQWISLNSNLNNNLSDSSNLNNRHGASRSSQRAECSQDLINLEVLASQALVRPNSRVLWVNLKVSEWAAHQECLVSKINSSQVLEALNNKSHSLEELKPPLSLELQALKSLSLEDKLKPQRQCLEVEPSNSNPLVNNNNSLSLVGVHNSSNPLLGLSH